ncbi:T-cell surface glycoprotein CD8 alpha chain [Anguilla rostrata]|uniref:T-cell surface glycoprotein CD8 alpha chain n=1 Tax=Anguilla rostrata TaxID=7938 RepID=UPI0030CC22CB
MAGLVHLCALFIWTTVAVQSIGWTTRYPELGKLESLQCSCREGQCQPAFWCRLRSGQFQFLFSHNTVDKSTYGSESDKLLYTGGVQVGSRAIYSLKIVRVTKEDAGLYFCVLMAKGVLYLGSAADLRPGETPPTLAPITTTTKAKAKAKAPPSCSCRDQGKTKPGKPVKGCSLAVFWSLVGTLVTQALVLLGTLLYFSRLPRKCRHRIAKR